MNRLLTFRHSKYTRLFIGAIAIAIVYLTAHLALEPLAPVRATEPDSSIQIDSLSPTTPPEPGIGWEISTTSGAAELELADYLTQKDVKVYGSYWCPHCYEQEQLFGKEAWSKINQIECAPDAQANPQPEVCERAGIKGYPTWSINGELTSGVKKLARLGEMAGYQGNTDFKYDRLLKQD